MLDVTAKFEFEMNEGDFLATCPTKSDELGTGRVRAIATQPNKRRAEKWCQRMVFLQ
jgi:hypothetical protein